MRKILMIALLATVATPAIAKDRKTAQTDPNRMICKNEEVIGSRLASKRTCMTAIQWEQLEREQRRTVDRMQTYKPHNGG